MKHQVERVDLTSSQVGTKLRADEILAQQAGSSRNQVQRYIRLTELIPELMDMVDEKKIALNPAYELSFLKKEEQVDLLDAMDSEQATPSLSQAQRLKKYSQEGHLTLDMMRVIMGEEKKSDLDRVTFTSDTLRKYFPKSYTPQRMQETIIKLLELSLIHIWNQNAILLDTVCGLHHGFVILDFEWMPFERVQFRQRDFYYFFSLSIGTALLRRKQIIYRCQFYFFRAAFQVSTPPSSDFDTPLPPYRQGHGRKCFFPLR